MNTSLLVRMKQIVPLFTLLLIASLAVGATGLLQSTVSIPTSGVIGNISTVVPWLHTSGTELYDDGNNVARLYLTVVFDGNGFKLKQSDFQNIAAMGFTGVRFFIYWGQCQPSPNTISTAYFSSGTGEPGGNSVDTIVNWCRDAGLYVLLCPGWSSYWTPPAWAQTSTGLTCPDGGPHVDMLNDATIQGGIQYLYTFLAQRYASYSNVCFESFNELQSESRPCSTAERQKWADFNNMWISTIENNEGATSHIKVLQMFYDWSQWNYVLSGPVVTGTHANIILATHSYPLVKSSASVASQCANAWASFAHNQGYPYMDTEYSHVQGGGFSGLQQGTNLLVQYGAVGWGYFEFDAPNNSDSTCNVNNAANQPSILAVLQPYMLSS
jgi:hypothetical protein